MFDKNFLWGTASSSLVFRHTAFQFHGHEYFLMELLRILTAISATTKPDLISMIRL